MVFLLFLASVVTLEFIVRGEAKAAKNHLPKLPASTGEQPVHGDLLALMKALEGTSPAVGKEIGKEQSQPAPGCVMEDATEVQKL
jgi:hypothetical protein